MQRLRLVLAPGLLLSATVAIAQVDVPANVTTRPYSSGTRAIDTVTYKVTLTKPGEPSRIATCSKSAFAIEATPAAVRGQVRRRSGPGALFETTISFDLHAAIDGRTVSLRLTDVKSAFGAPGARPHHGPSAIWIGNGSGYALDLAELNAAVRRFETCMAG